MTVTARTRKIRLRCFMRRRSSPLWDAGEEKPRRCQTAKISSPDLQPSLPCSQVFLAAKSSLQPSLPCSQVFLAAKSSLQPSLPCSQVFAFSRRRRRPSFARARPSESERAQGRPGTGWHPWSACRKKARGRTTGSAEDTRPSLRNGFNGVLRALPGDRALLPPSLAKHARGVFCFTMLQEIIARSLDREIGIYRHFAGSLHLYKSRWSDAQHFIDEAYQQRIAMPEMPEGDPWLAIDGVLKAEERIRNGEQVEAGSLGLPEYWSDLVRIIQIYFATGRPEKVEELAGAISFRRYRPYIMGRLQGAREG
jgi:hypothetical protein